MLNAAAGLPKDELQNAIDKLLDSELIFKHGMAPDIVYEFKHAMVQDIAYQTLLKSTRQRYHQRIAHLLEHQFSETVENNPELIAHHYSEAHLAEQALTHWQMAGQKAISRSANLEAINHLQKGLTTLSHLPDDEEKIKRELELQITLAVPLTSAKGYASPEVEQTYTRARELCLKIGDTPQLFPAIYGMWRFYLLRAEYTTAYKLSQELLDIANRAQDATFFSAAPRSIGATLFYQGNISQSRTHLEQVIQLQTTDDIRSRTLKYDVVDAQVVSLGYNAWALWLQGFPDQARQHSDQSITLARDYNHQFSIALATSFASWTYQFCGIKKRTSEIAQSALELSEKQGFQFWVGWAKLMSAWSKAELDADQKRSKLMDEGLQQWRETGSKLGQTYFLTLLAEVAALEGQYDQSLALLDEAQLFAEHTGENFWLAEIYRNRGTLILQTPSIADTQAEQWLIKATDIAATQNSKSLELRAYISLHEYFQSHSDKDGILQSSASIKSLYASFTEGFDTMDLINAKNILEN